VIVFDGETGAYLRHWGAYGERPDDTYRSNRDPDGPAPRQFSTPHGLIGSNDGLIYVADRRGNRIQVFQQSGEFVTEKIIARKTLGGGSTWDIAFSRDTGQKFLYLADGQNMKIYVIERKTMEILTTFGDGGRQPGQFYGVHSIATDSKGNIYTTETYEGKRVQKFVYKGLGTAEENQGVVWPTAPL
jgi:DNA-binding beta-propeller fold protein YncE